MAVHGDYQEPQNYYQDKKTNKCGKKKLRKDYQKNKYQKKENYTRKVKALYAKTEKKYCMETIKYHQKEKYVDKAKYQQKEKYGTKAKYPQKEQYGKKVKCQQNGESYPKKMYYQQKSEGQHTKY